MIAYSTCRDCGGLLHVTTPGDTVHPTCAPKPTKAERLAQEWLAAAIAGDDAVADGLQELIDEIDARPPRMLDAALLYASWGWPVFPLLPMSRARDINKCTGEGVDKLRKRPATRNGFKDAATDADRIRAWWTRHPDSCIGLATGVAFDVIDIDTPHGIPTYLKLLESDALPDSHGMVSTASGGIHHYITPLGGGNLAGTLPGLDYRGAGGYVVAPPSRIEERHTSWSWVNRPSPAITGVNR